MSDKIKKGGISVETNHIFPIIKKWLYSEKDIFLREIVSNASDAITKLRRLISLGEAKEIDSAFRIDVICDKEARTLTVSDNGIGMTPEELEKYICNIALSGALDFIQKYECTDSDGGNGIIGHFGLGFYSAFMVCDKVEIITKSYTDTPAVHWVCNEAGEYEISNGERESFGTDIVMHINDGEDYIEKKDVLSVLQRYCAFMPVDIFVSDGSDDESKAPINDTLPLWQKNPSDCTPEDYKNFYHKVFLDPRDPLFWIHINADYPLNFKGILFFPALNNEYDAIEGQVKLYYNQVFVADNIKEVIPEYLLMLKGVLDCPELPLNVSRSYLQTNSYVSKVSAHIVKKVADKLNFMLNTARKDYEKAWDDIKTFIEYACMRDRKFYDRVKDSLLLHLTNGTYVTIPEYLEAAKATNENKIYYATDTSLQSQYISLLEGKGIKIALFQHVIDTQFAGMLEDFSESVKYLRVDSDVATALGEGTASESEMLCELFKNASGNPDLSVSVSALSDVNIPALLNVSEDSRRMSEMMRLYAMRNGDNDAPAFPAEMTLVLNSESQLIKKLELLSSDNPEKAKKIASYIYKLSLLSQRKLSADEMTAFLADGFAILSEL